MLVWSVRGSIRHDRRRWRRTRLRKLMMVLLRAQWIKFVNVFDLFRLLLLWWSLVSSLRCLLSFRYFLLLVQHDSELQYLEILHGQAKLCVIADSNHYVIIVLVPDLDCIRWR